MKFGSMILIVIISDRRKLRIIKLVPIKIILVGFLSELGIEPTLHGVIFFDFDFWWFFFVA